MAQPRKRKLREVFRRKVSTVAEEKREAADKRPEETSPKIATAEEDEHFPLPLFDEHKSKSRFSFFENRLLLGLLGFAFI